MDYAYKHHNMSCLTVGDSTTVYPNQKETRFVSLRCLHCHAIFNQTTLSFIIKGSFSFFLFDTKHMMISECMTEKEQFKLMHVKIDLRRITVLS